MQIQGKLWDWIYQGRWEFCVCNDKKAAHLTSTTTLKGPGTFCKRPRLWDVQAQFSFKNRIKVSLQVVLLLGAILKYVCGRLTPAWQQLYPEVKARIRFWKMKEKKIRSPLSPSSTTYYLFLPCSWLVHSSRKVDFPIKLVFSKMHSCVTSEAAQKTHHWDWL